MFSEVYLYEELMEADLHAIVCLAYFEHGGHSPYDLDSLRPAFV